MCPNKSMNRATQTSINQTSSDMCFIPKNSIQIASSTKKSEKYLKVLIKKEKKPLMGIAYINPFSDKFHCYLCEKTFHLKLIIGHLTGNSHRMNYCVSVKIEGIQCRKIWQLY